MGNLSCTLMEKNVNHGETISAPSSDFVDNPFRGILDNAASRDVLFDLPRNYGIISSDLHRRFQNLNWKEIWNLHCELHKLERLDEDSRKYAVRLEPGLSAGFQILKRSAISLIVLWKHCKW